MTEAALTPLVAPPRTCEELAAAYLGFPFPLFVPAPTPETQVVRPPFFANKNEFYAPLVQVVPTAERMLSDKVTSAELKHVLEANAKALRHGGKPTTLGYGTDWATIQELAAKRLRGKSEQLKAREPRHHQIDDDDARLLVEVDARVHAARDHGEPPALLEKRILDHGPRRFVIDDDHRGTAPSDFRIRRRRELEIRRVDGLREELLDRHEPGVLSVA